MPGTADAGKVTWNILASSGATNPATIGLVGTGNITDNATQGTFRSTEQDQ